MMDWNGHMTAAGWVLMILWTLIIVGLIAGVIYWLIAARNPAPEVGEKRSREPNAKEILDRRLAGGELTVEQYEQLHDTLEARSSSAGEARAAEERAPTPR
jgi:uncharacterized membrane protein